MAALAHELRARSGQRRPDAATPVRLGAEDVLKLGRILAPVDARMADRLAVRPRDEGLASRLVEPRQRNLGVDDPDLVAGERADLDHEPSIRRRSCSAPSLSSI